MTLRSLSPGPAADHTDFLARADILAALGFDVLISRFEPYYQLAEYLTRYTDQMIGLAVGLPAAREVAEEKYYKDLPGGVLESVGRLFKRSVKMYVYPSRDAATGQVHTADTVAIPPPWHHLYRLLSDIGRVEPIRSYNEDYLSIRTPDVLARIERGDPSWEAMVPAPWHRSSRRNTCSTSQPRLASKLRPDVPPPRGRPQLRPAGAANGAVIHPHGLRACAVGYCLPPLRG